MKPDIDTDRLTLRRHRPEDLPDSAAMWGDEDVVRYIGGQPQSAEEVWGKILRLIGHWEAMGFGYWVVREKATGRFVGEVGFGDFKRDIMPAFEGAPEAGWALATWAHGKGHAAEAMRAALTWGDERFEGARMVCLISPENLRSLRLAEALGFREYARTTYKGSATTLLERLP